MRRITTAREYYELSAPWREAVNFSDLQDYRTERHRQEVELEGLTGGYPADTADHFARGGKPLINYSDWLKSKKIGDGEQAAREGPVSHDVYTPDPAKWGSKRKEAVPANPSAQWGADVKRHIDQNGGWGLTMRDHPGDAPTSGFMVSHPGEREQSRSTLDPHSIRQFVHDKSDLINSHPDNYYGGWEAPRTEESGKGGQPGWYHDVSRNMQDPHDAADMALRNKQQAVYDLDHDEEVQTPDLVNRATHPGIGVFSRRWYR